MQLASVNCQPMQRWLQAIWNMGAGLLRVHRLKAQLPPSSVLSDITGVTQTLMKLLSASVKEESTP